MFMKLLSNMLSFTITLNLLAGLFDGLFGGYNMLFESHMRATDSFSKAFWELYTNFKDAFIKHL
jgi:hypothetical protein